ncbi:DUF4124 domain-containing protein [Frateuria sp.]|uniref:DUF4124 domain-containing protein n=1 Tax=Frateuria sp. TaxID=2211372 RepID=UPI0018450134|nr:DUF4124 domain-containing protein [Frateuria sp.]NUR23795.1 DUF4124 domain-containing protein [Frateuria sp.]
MRRLLLILALLLLAPAVAAQAYKWTDAQGTVHYSEMPPPQGTPFKRITTTGSVQAPPASRSAGSTPNEKPQPERQPAVADTPENRAKLCSSLKANLDMLRGSGPVVMEQQGKPVALDDEQRNQQTALAEKQYVQFCSQ